MFESLSVFEDHSSGIALRVRSREQLRRLVIRRWCGVWDNKPLTSKRYVPQEETVMPNPRFL